MKILSKKLFLLLLPVACSAGYYPDDSTVAFERGGGEERNMGGERGRGGEQGRYNEAGRYGGQAGRYGEAGRYGAGRYGQPSVNVSGQQQPTTVVVPQPTPAPNPQQ